jgi:hypothetical protein
VSAWSWIIKVGRIVGLVAPEIVDAVEGVPPKLDPALGESKTEQVRREADAQRAAAAAAARKDKPLS